MRASVSTSWAAPRGLVGLLAIRWSRLPPSTILERKERPAFVLAGLENLHDVGMKQLGDGFRLGAKPRQAHLTDMRSRQDHLERDQSLQPAMPGLVDDPHAAPAEFLQDVVARNGHALERGYGWRKRTHRRVGPGGVNR